MHSEVVILDENKSFSFHIETFLKQKGFAVRQVSSEEVVALSIQQLKVLLISDTVHNSTTDTLIKKLRLMGHTAHIIVLMDNLSTAQQIAYMKSGASDLFDRSLHPVELLLSIQAAFEYATILENLNRELSFSLEEQVKDKLENIKALLEKKKKSDESLLPSDIAQFVHIQKPKILVVEDEQFMSKTISSVLSKEFDVLTASTGEEGLDILTKNTPKIDLILLDIGLPGKTGDKWISEYLNQNPDVDILILTAYKDTDFIVKTFRSGVKDYLLKPFLNHKLLEKVSQAVQHKLIRDSVLKVMELKRVRRV